MITYLVTFLIALVSSLMLTRLAILTGNRLHLMDASWGRKIHKSPVPRIGGASVIISFFLPLIGLFFWDNRISRAWTGQPQQIMAIVGGGLMIGMVGLWDDILGMKARWKLLFQVLIASFVHFIGIRITKISLPFGVSPLHLGMWSYPVTVMWIVGMVNAINLIDGMDGLCGGITFIASMSVAIMSMINHTSPLVPFWMFALGGAVLGFLYYNFYPARIFLGDGGSYFIGFILATTSMLGAQKASVTTALLVPVLLFGIPIMDTTLAVLRRATRGRHIFSPDDEHIHHKLLQMGLSVPRAAMILYAIAIMLAGTGILLLVLRSWAQIISLTAALTIMTGLLYYTKSWPFQGESAEGWSDFIGVREKQFVEHVHALIEDLQHIETIDDFSNRLHEFAELMTISEIAFKHHTIAQQRLIVRPQSIDKELISKTNMLSYRYELSNGTISILWPSESPRISLQYTVSMELICRILLYRWFALSAQLDKGE